LLGVALGTSIGSTTAHLAQLAVAPEARGRGLAQTLLAAARANADRVLRASRISLLVSTANTRALRLYARAGFRRTGDFVAAARGGRRVSQPLERPVRLAFPVHQHRAGDRW
jgi:ribosomal protein S18 acetylase RimI-like enzyme